MIPRAKLKALETAAHCLDAGQPIPPNIAAWLANGFRQYCATPDSDLDGVLLLKPTIGKSSPWSQARRERILELFTCLAHYLGGVNWNNCDAIGRMLRGEEPCPPDEPGLWVLELAKLHAPASQNRIWTLLSENTQYFKS